MKRVLKNLSTGMTNASIYMVIMLKNNQRYLAVAISDQVALLHANGSLLGSAVQQFSKLKALTFDNIRHQFVVSDVDQNNDTIYSVQLTKQTDITPIVSDLPDDVQGLAIDPITDILYWTDSINKTINYVSLNDPKHESKIFLQFDNQNPQDLSIDVCHRYIYWTNSDITNPTIERATLDGPVREVVIERDLFMPAGITVDHFTRRIFWADKREGIYYRIESAKFDGSQREIIFEGTHQTPFGVAVDADAVYWTDLNNNALWKKNKNKNHDPEKLHHFKENPMGIVSKRIIQNLTECDSFFDALENYNGSVKEYFEVADDSDNEVLECLNGGVFENGECNCKRGFTGERCEMSLCHNFCLNGNCYMSSVGAPQCRCPLGFMGARCERNACDDFCLNEGTCLKSANTVYGVECRCQEGYFGKRCEKSRCGDASIALERDHKLTAYEANETDAYTSAINRLEDPTYLILSVVMLVMLVIIIVQAICVCKFRRQPRIKKRIIVNKNVTPLTFRPQPTSQQCEITIENCCNMNVCETPCFEPPQLRDFQVTKKDEKKNLLSHMENGEDLY